MDLHSHRPFIHSFQNWRTSQNHPRMPTCTLASTSSPALLIRTIPSPPTWQSFPKTRRLSAGCKRGGVEDTTPSSSAVDRSGPTNCSKSSWFRRPTEEKEASKQVSEFQLVGGSTSGSPHWMMSLFVNLSSSFIYFFNYIHI